MASKIIQRLDHGVNPATTKSDRLRPICCPHESGFGPSATFSDVRYCALVAVKRTSGAPEPSTPI